MLVQRAENPRGRGGGRPAAARASHRESVPLPADTRIILYREKTRSSMYDIRLMGGLAVGGIWLSGRPDGTFCAFVVCDLPVANRQTVDRDHGWVAGYGDVAARHPRICRIADVADPPAWSGCQGLGNRVQDLLLVGA